MAVNNPNCELCHRAIKKGQLCNKCLGEIMRKQTSKLIKSKDNPFIESMIGGLGIGTGFTLGASIVKGVMEQKKNPLPKQYRKRSKYWNPITFVGRKSPEEILREQKYTDYKVWGHKDGEASAHASAQWLARSMHANVKVYTIDGTNRYVLMYKERGR